MIYILLHLDFQVLASEPSCMLSHSSLDYLHPTGVLISCVSVMYGFIQGLASEVVDVQLSANHALILSCISLVVLTGMIT